MCSIFLFWTCVIVICESVSGASPVIVRTICQSPNYMASLKPEDVEIIV